MATSKDLNALWTELQAAVTTFNETKAADDAAHTAAAQTAATHERSRQAVAAKRAALQGTMDELLPPADSRVRVS